MGNRYGEWIPSTQEEYPNKEDEWLDFTQEDSKGGQVWIDNGWNQFGPEHIDSGSLGLGEEGPSPLYWRHWVRPRYTVHCRCEDRIAGPHAHWGHLECPGFTQSKIERNAACGKKASIPAKSDSEESEESDKEETPIDTPLDPPVVSREDSPHIDTDIYFDTTSIPFLGCPLWQHFRSV